MSKALKSAALMIIVAGCRPDAGTPNYPGADPWDPVADDPDFQQGTDPWVEGEARLSLGIFYEGGASEVVPVDEVTSHFYIYETSFSMGVTDDCVEGVVADALATSGGPWWGGGVHWDAAGDLSSWTTLHIALKTSAESMAGWDLGMTGGGTEGRVSVADAGLVADGEWHDLWISLDDFALDGVDLSAVTVPLLLVGEGGVDGDTVLIDDFYFTAEAL